MTFEIDADGIVNVTASDQATGQAASTQITLSSGLGDEQIEKLIDQNVAGRVATPTSPAARAVSPKPNAGARPPETNTIELAGDTDFGDGSVDLSLGRRDEIDLGPADDESELDLLDDEDLIRLTREDDLAGEDITLDCPADEAGEDDGFFDKSGADLSSSELELLDEEK